MSNYKVATICGRQVLLKAVDRKNQKAAGEAIPNPCYHDLKGFALAGFMLDGETIEECLTRYEERKLNKKRKNGRTNQRSRKDAQGANGLRGITPKPVLCKGEKKA